MTIDESTIPDSAIAVSTSKDIIHLVFRNRPAKLNIGLLPYCPGTFRLMPSTVTAPEAAQVRDHFGKERIITICPSEEYSPSPYTWSEEEHLAFGLACYNDGDYENALRHFEKLDCEVFKNHSSEAVAMLSIYCDDRFYTNKYIIEFFELIRNHHPSAVISLTLLTAVAKAYRQQKEYETACELWRSILRMSFYNELPAAEDLKEAGEFEQAVSWLENVFMTYPDEDEILECYYHLALYLRASVDNLDDINEKRDSDNKIRAFELKKKAISLLTRFIALHPKTPYADEAVFNLLSLYAETGLDEKCLKLASSAVKTFPDSDYCDKFRYLKALSSFNLGDFKAAINAAKVVADSNSDESELATFLLAQMYHATGNYTKAIESYKLVEDEYSDAMMSIHYLERQSLKVDEVTTGTPGQTVNLNLSYCNTEQIDILAYKVDLMRLFLKEKNLDRIANINLAGIIPSCTFTSKLPPVPRGTTGKTMIKLPFKETGAYLVLIRSEKSFTSGLALISPLSLEIQETEDGVRVTILEGTKKQPAKDVFIKVSNGDTFENGVSDFRGTSTIEIDQYEGITVIAKRTKDEFAFYRSKTEEDRDLPWFDISENVSYISDVLDESEELCSEGYSSLTDKISNPAGADRMILVSEL